MSETANVVEVSQNDFQQQVVEKSRELPVLVDFWADWCAPCKMLLPVLLRLAEEYQGKFRLAKVNTDVERGLAEQHGIRSLPTLRLYRHGEVVEEMLGAQPESTLRELLDNYIERESDRSLEQALALAAEGRRAEAVELLARAWEEDPGNLRLPLEYARLALEDGQLERAGKVLDELPRELRSSPQATSLRALLDMARATEHAPSTEALQATVDADPDQSEARYQLAARRLLEGDYDQALEQFMELLKRDRNWGDGAARKGLLAVFELLGEDDERVGRYRRQMFALLH